MKITETIKNLFSKSSQTTELTVRLLGNVIPENTTNFEGFVNEGYGQNPTVFSCIDEIAKAVGGIKWQLFQTRGKDKVQIKEHEILNLIRRPNEFEGQAFFFQKIIGFLLIHGNSFIEHVGPENRPPKELFVLRPDRIKVIPDSKNLISGYEYETGGQKVIFTFDEILHLKTFSPLDDWFGLSPLSVAARDIDSDNAAKKWNFNLLSNSARPAGALITESKLNNDQFSRLKNQIKKMYGGVSNAGKPLLLDAGLDWKQFSLSPSDMDWLNGRKLSALQICQVFGVPPEIIGMPDSKTYASYQEARKSFYLETVLPYMDRIRDDLNVWLTPLFGDNLNLEYDRDAIEALQENREKVWGRIKDASWMTLNEKRAATGFDEIDGGDVILVPANMLPLNIVNDSVGQNV